MIGLGAGAIAVACLGIGVYSLSGEHEVPIDEKATVSSNFYQAINKDWIKKAKIPSDSPVQSVASEIQDNIDKDMMKDVENLVSGKETSDLLGMSEFIEFYKLATDYKAREKEGTAPIQPYLEEIENLKSLEDLSSNISQRTLEGLAQPYGIGISYDFKETSKKQIVLSSPGLFLLDVSYYKDEATKKQLEGLFKSSTENLLTKVGYDKKQAVNIVKGALVFDDKLVDYTPSAEELSDIKKSYNVRSAEEVKAYSKTFDFSKAINELVKQDVTEINVANPKFFEAFDKIISEENFENIKSWLLVQEVMAMSSLLTEEIRVAGGEFERAVSGIAEPISKDEATFNLAISGFSPVFSTYYGQKYFGKEAKQDVTGMVDNIIDVYKERLSKNDWLTDKTKSKAVEKLENMTYYIGYPEEVPEEIGRIDIDPNKSMVENMINLSLQEVSYSFEHFNEPVDKTEWVAESYGVNAFYNPTNNSITFPAAILNDPFYSKNQKDAQNYGAIGAVIGHEITHAFDSNGSKFDKEGNLSNWWTEADKKAFEKKTDAMVKLWDGVEIFGGKVNGQLTVTENTADAGGLSASLEALQKSDSSVDLKLFFENYAKIWRQKSSLEFNKLMLGTDEHAPAELRVNLQLKNLDAFYDTYDIKKGDEMYLPKDKRVSIW